MPAKGTPQRLSLVSATSGSTIDSPCSVPSEAMSTPHTPFSPEARPFAPATSATYSNSLVYVSPEYQAPRDQQLRIQQSHSKWRQQDALVQRHLYARHPNLHHICPKLIGLPYHWSALLYDLRYFSCFCDRTKRQIPCLKHDWRNDWAFLATGGPWRPGKYGAKQEYKPQVPDILQRALDGVVFHKWLADLPCSCEAWESAWKRHLEEHFGQRYFEGQRVTEEQFKQWMKTQYCVCQNWIQQWHRLFRMVEDADTPIIPRTPTDQESFNRVQETAKEAAKEARRKNLLAKEARRQKGQQMDILPAFNNHIFDLSMAQTFIPDEWLFRTGVEWIDVDRGKRIKKSPVLCRATMWCPGKDELGTELGTYADIPGDRSLAAIWPTHNEYIYEGGQRNSTEGGIFRRAFPLVGKYDMESKQRPMTIVNVQPKDSSSEGRYETRQNNYENRPWLLPLDLDRSSWPLYEYSIESNTFTTTSFDCDTCCRHCVEEYSQLMEERYGPQEARIRSSVLYDGGYCCESCIEFGIPHEIAGGDATIEWPSLGKVLLTALDDPDLVELDDAGQADDTAYEIWKTWGL